MADNIGRGSGGDHRNMPGWVLEGDELRGTRKKPRKERLERSRELLAWHQEAKNTEMMADCQARNDHAGDPCGHRPGLALDDATVDPVAHFEQNYTAADTKGSRESDERRAGHDGGPHR